jgi:predicted O-linked N-acetylglucosamine transferase (SPINDLY family)
LRRFGEALASYGSALTLKPNNAAIHLNSAIALMALGRAGEALNSCDRALALEADFAQAHVIRAAALKELQDFAEAIASCEAALALESGHKYALAAAAECAAKSCDWRWRQSNEQELRRSLVEHTSIVPPFLALSHFDDAALQLSCAKSFLADQIGSPVPRKSALLARRNQRIRLGYLSADFRRHATAYLIADLIERHDRERFEVVGLSIGPDDASDMRARLACAFDRFVDLAGKTDEESARTIESLRVDILIDLMGHTQFARPGVLALRPAPIQAHYLAFPGTTGADFTDYIIADPTVAPFERQVHYSERIVHLPHCYQPPGSRPVVAEVAPSRSAMELPDDGFVFCCFNAVWKITPAMFDVWMCLLDATPRSVLWLMRDNPHAERNLRSEAAARGVDPSRIVFADRLTPEDHLARHGCADLFLDTAPYNAHTTGSDALWAGLPLVTCPGATFAARVAASLLSAVGLPELIASSLEDYEALALQLAGDASLLRRIREKLKANRQSHPLFDAERFRDSIEAAYETMWRHWRNGDMPRSFQVEPQPAPRV